MPPKEKNFSPILLSFDNQTNRLSLKYDSEQHKKICIHTDSNYCHYEVHITSRNGGILRLEERPKRFLLYTFRYQLNGVTSEKLSLKNRVTIGRKKIGNRKEEELYLFFEIEKRENATAGHYTDEIKIDIISSL